MDGMKPETETGSRNEWQCKVTAETHLNKCNVVLVMFFERSDLILLLILSWY